jgi:hypothetical protein
MWHRVDMVLTEVSEEHRLTLYLHGATSQKTAFISDNQNRQFIAHQLGNMKEAIQITEIKGIDRVM